MTVALLVALTLAGAPKIEKPKLDMPKLDAPKLDWSKDKTDTKGLTGPAKEESPRLREGPGDPDQPRASGPSASVQSVVHAKDFAVTGEGRKPKGAIEGFAVEKFPARIDAFKTCLRLQSKEGAPAAVKVQLKTPAGSELLSSRGEAVFNSGNLVDFVIDWEGFQATGPGDYKVVVSVDGTPKEYVLPVKQK